MTARSTPARLAAALAFAVLPTVASAAATCYTVYDRAGEVAYRDFVSPFEGALDPMSSGREAMRTRGEHLVFFEAEFCPQVSRVVGLGSLQGRPPTTDEIVATFPTLGEATATRATPGVPASYAPATATAGGPIGRVTAPATNAIQTRMGSYK